MDEKKNACILLLIDLCLTERHFCLREQDEFSKGQIAAKDGRQNPGRDS
jgi:hypothetical protein